MFTFKSYYKQVHEVEGCNKVTLYQGYRNFRVYAPKPSSKTQYKTEKVNGKTYIAYDEKLNQKNKKEYKKLKNAVKKRMKQSFKNMRFYLKEFAEPNECQNGVNAHFYVAAFDTDPKEFYAAFELAFENKDPFVFTEGANGDPIPEFAKVDDSCPKKDTNGDTEPTETNSVIPSVSVSTDTGTDTDLDDTSEMSSTGTATSPDEGEKNTLPTPNQPTVSSGVTTNSPSLPLKMDGYWDTPQFIGGHVIDTFLTLNTVTGISGPDSSIKLNFTTVDKQGILLYAASNQNKKDFFLMYVRHGRVEIMFDLGMGVKKIETGTNVLDGEEHQVAFDRRLRYYEVRVDNEKKISGNYVTGASRFWVGEVFVAKIEKKIFFATHFLKIDQGEAWPTLFFF